MNCRIGGDEQEVVVGASKCEIHGSRQANLAQQIRIRTEDLDSACRRDVHATVAVRFDPVRESGRDDREQTLIGQVPAVVDIERDDPMRAARRIVASPWIAPLSPT